ncbi:uncharacterized protein LOC117173858 [Belonocnema kinseyi]|uniref:uncharacterized protein LOC117173858 n=1 Tax=Belonocnema kinseyi TaxID=2817044 RepID=UPI00143DDC77|nr:uncharacterized protein LOC117173858 [Belonocnema kinseyi]
MEDLIFLALLFFLLALDSVQSSPFEPPLVGSRHSKPELPVGQIVRAPNKQLYIISSSPGHLSEGFNVDLENVQLVLLNAKQMAIYERLKSRPNTIPDDYVIPPFFYKEGDELHRKVGEEYQKVGEARDWQTMNDIKTVHQRFPSIIRPQEGDRLVSFVTVRWNHVGPVKLLRHVATYLDREWIAVKLLPGPGEA